MLVHDFLRRSVTRTPDAIAIIEPSVTATYYQLDLLANRSANALIAAGVKRGDRVVLATADGIESAACYFGTMKAGAVAVPLAPGPQNDRLVRAVEDCSPVAAVVSPATADSVAAAALDRLRGGTFVTGGAVGGPSPAQHPFPTWAEALVAAPDDEPKVRMTDLDLAAIVYSCGGSGAPRGAMLSHLNIRSNTESIVACLRLTGADRVTCVLPLSGAYGLSLLHTHVAVGGSVIVDTGFASPDVVLKAMQAHRATGLAGVPSALALLLHRSNLTEMEFPDLRYVTQVGRATAQARIREWLSKGTKVAFHLMYGATAACAPLTCLGPGDVEGKLESIGRPLPNVEVLIVDEKGRVAAPGEVGEFLARGSSVSCGYWKDGHETVERFGHLGYRTGDLGYADDEGFLYLVGRKHDRNRAGAHAVNTKDVERRRQVSR